MKILYKLFLFAVIIRLIPAVITSMGIFPNTVFDNLGFNFSSTDDAMSIFSDLMFPFPIDLSAIPGVGILHFTLAVGISAIIVIALFQALRIDAVPAFVAGITVFLVCPFILSVGYALASSTNAFNSSSVTLMMITIFVGFIVLAMITILESVSHSEDVSDA